METKEKNFLNDTKSYLWYDPYLFKEGNDGMLKRCISNDEVEGVLYHQHNSKYGDHFGSTITSCKVLESSLYWPTLFKDSLLYVKTCDS